MKKENGKKVEPSVVGTSAVIKKMISHKISQAKIIEVLLPQYLEKGISEQRAKKRIRPLVYRELKRREANKKK